MAIKCDNCDNKAAYTTADPGVNPAHYCTSCLPHWLKGRADAGHFPLMEAITTDEAEQPQVADESKPKKKTQTKAAVSEDSN
jgi:hypothetical protein